MNSFSYCFPPLLFIDFNMVTLSINKDFQKNWISAIYIGCSFQTFSFIVEAFSFLDSCRNQVLPLKEIPSSGEASWPTPFKFPSLKEKHFGGITYSVYFPVDIFPSLQIINSYRRSLAPYANLGRWVK